jgi:RNA polymerase sigma-70 factor (ECF subfamily)
VRLKDFHLRPELLNAARAGDHAALETFYRGAARAAYTLIRRMVPGSAAEDLLQEAFLDAFRALPDFDGRAPIGAWFRSIVVRRCLMHLRSPWQRGRLWLESRRGESAPDWLEEWAVPDRDAAIQLDLERLLDRLPATTRMVVWLYDVEGYSHEEIAAMFGRTTSFSKSQLARGHGRLREWLDANSSAEGAQCAALKL